jgi:tRNA(adenine34) deaminase
MRKHQKWMAEAIKHAISSAQNGDAPVAALIVQHDTLLSVGRNTKTSEKSGFAHAELNALWAAKILLGRKPEGCTLYTTLEPCAMCLGAITFSGIRKLVFGSPDPEGGAVDMFAQHQAYGNWMPEVIGGILQVECDALKTLPTLIGKNTINIST